MAEKPDKSKKTPRGGGSDPNDIAARILRQATGEEPKDEGKDPKAVERGKARANKLTPEERAEIAKKGAEARWGDDQEPEDD